MDCGNDWIMTEDCCKNKHEGTHKDISLQIIDYCDPNNQERHFGTR